MAETPGERLTRLRARFAEAAAQVEADRQAQAEGTAEATPTTAANVRTAPPTPTPPPGPVETAPEDEGPEETPPEPARVGGVAATGESRAPSASAAAAPRPAPTAPAWQPTPAAPPAAAPPSSPPPSGPPTAVTSVRPARRAPRGAGVSSAVIIAAAVVIGALILIGVGIALGRASQESGVKYSDLKAGDCFQQPSGRFNRVKTVPCTSDHDLEVYAVLDHPAPPKAPFPGMDALVRYANPLCLAQFRSYAGVAFEQVNLRDVYITPRASAWNNGARRLVCAVGSSNGQRTNKSIKAGAK